MLWIILLAGLVAIIWIARRESRESSRAQQIREVQRLDWVPNKELGCAICQGVLHETNVMPEADSSMGPIIYCSNKNCPVWLWALYFRNDGVWIANPLIVPLTA